MAETIDDYPAQATTAAKEWIDTEGPPRNTNMLTDLRSHYTLPDTYATSTKPSWISYLFSRFVRNRGLDV